MVVATPLMEDLREMCQRLEEQELEAQLSSGKVGGELYLQLLAGHLALRQLARAKFLWQRIPATTKEETPELGKIWNVGKCMWTRDNPGVFASLQGDWSELVRPIVEQIVAGYRADAFQLVGAAYSTIRLADLGLYLGLPDQEAGELAIRAGWTLDVNTGIVTPLQQRNNAQERRLLEGQLKKVTEFISYLEN